MLTLQALLMMFSSSHALGLSFDLLGTKVERAVLVATAGTIKGCFPDCVLASVSTSESVQLSQ